MLFAFNITKLAINSTVFAEEKSREVFCSKIPFLQKLETCELKEAVVCFFFNLFLREKNEKGKFALVFNRCMRKLSDLPEAYFQGAFQFLVNILTLQLRHLKVYIYQCIR